MDTTPPIAFIIFNRPDCTRLSFERIREAKPQKLYLIADGPRESKPDEVALCNETRSLVEEMINWDCHVLKNYSDENLGCRRRVISGLNWVFNYEDSAIIMEDDILADLSFFKFCSEMLERYKNHPQVMQIIGYNELNYHPSSGESYFFSRFTHCWGWATWKQSWEQYQEKRVNLEEDVKNLKHYFPEKIVTSWVEKIIRVEEGKCDSWGTHLGFGIRAAGGLCIIPSKNLLRNIGFGAGAAHTVNPFTLKRFKRICSFNFDQRVQNKVRADEKHDTKALKKLERSSLITRVKDKLFFFLFRPDLSSRKS
ncbi:MAG: hypothetical protein V3V05_09980 [Pontiella sp.]